MKSFLKNAIRPALIYSIITTILGTALFALLSGDYEHCKRPLSYIIGFIVLLISYLLIQYRRLKKES
jgi:membrane protein DedA with SNARE-associated domain